MEASSLSEVLATTPDPRDRSGLRHPLPAALNLLVVATLAGMRSLTAVAQFARDHGKSLAHALGFRSAKTPCQATLPNLLRQLDVDAVEAALGRRVAARRPDLGNRPCLDGETVRGTRTGSIPGVHLLAAYAPHVAAVAAQVRVDGKTDEHKAALELSGVLPLTGLVVSGGAMFCHADVCQAVLKGGGDYLLPVKGNQPTLHHGIACTFAESSAFSPLPTEAVGL